MTAIAEWPGLADATSTLAHLLEGENLLELRALNVSGQVISGYFTQGIHAAGIAHAIDGQASGIYVTLNPIKDELRNRVAPKPTRSPKSTTGDKDIARRSFLLIDTDPVRPSGVSATDEEKRAAIELSDRIRGFLSDCGWPEPVIADSGNGGHLLYRVELPAEDDGLIKRVLAALAITFDRDDVTVDQSVHNPARISKLYGTMACKGINTPERPHRRSAIRQNPTQLTAVTREHLEALVCSRPRDPGHRPPDPGSGPKIDLDAFLAKCQIGVRNVKPWGNGKRWLLAQCAFNPDHKDGSAYVVQFGNGAIAAGCHHNSCQGLGWKELRAKVDPTGAATSGSSGSGPGGAAEISWPDPQPLNDELPPVKLFDPALLPAVFRGWVVDIADRVQCPMDFLGIALLIVLATLVGRRIGIRPKRHDDWLVVPNLWGAAIGRPGILKTPALQEIIKPLRRLEVEARKAFEKLIAQYTQEAVIAAEKRKVAKKHIREALEDEEQDPAEVAKTELDEMPEKPTRVRYTANDATVEKLGEILAENPNGVLVFRDELIGLLRGLDRDGQESARAFYLEAWNGTSSFTYDRIGRGTVEIEAAILSILGCIQPGPLSTYLRGAVNGTSQDDGLMQRFQMGVWPDVAREWVNVDRWPETKSRQEAFDAIKLLSELTAEAAGAEPDKFDPDGIPFLHFDDEGQKLFDAFRADLEKRVRNDSEHPVMESHLAKYRSLMPSIALLLHLADGQSGPVQAVYVRMAIEWCSYLESHARRIFSVVINADVAAAKALSKKLIDGSLKDKFALREVYRHGWTGLNTRDEAERAVKLLADLDWLVESVEKGPLGAPKTTYCVNPKVRGMKPPSKAADTTDKSADDAEEI
jgi:hypothetical protein